MDRLNDAMAYRGMHLAEPVDRKTLGGITLCRISASGAFAAMRRHAVERLPH